MLQSHQVAAYYSTLGYLIPIISVLAMAISAFNLREACPTALHYTDHARSAQGQVLDEPVPECPSRLRRLGHLHAGPLVRSQSPPKHHAGRDPTNRNPIIQLESIGCVCHLAVCQHLVWQRRARQAARL